MRGLTRLILTIFTSLLAFSCQESRYSTWEVYGGGVENIRYSTLEQIDTGNVHRLEKVWEYRAGDADAFTQIQTNPIIVGSTLYGVSPKLKLFALDAATGVRKWQFDPYTVDNQDTKGPGYFSMNVCRGLTYYAGHSQARLFYAAGASLFCIEAESGKPLTSFGEEGRLDLHQDLGRDVADLYIAMTTPGVIYGDLLIIGSKVEENAAAAPGYIRAYDVQTGKLRWKFHTIPQPGEEGYESWDDPDAWKHIGGANAWAGFSLDAARGILYAPLGSASYDFYGGKRTGDNLYANAILALDAATGKHLWHFQTVHHDVWDRDLPTAPALVTLKIKGEMVDALAQPTKSGFIFLLDRVTGRPLFPVDERPVPTQSGLRGEKLAQTQPWPRGIAPFARQSFTEADINPFVSKREQDSIRQVLRKVSTGFMFNPPSEQGTVIFPGFDGGAEWGGPAFDPSTGLLYVNANEMPWILTMVPREVQAARQETKGQAGARLYRANCMACHGPERKGSGENPTLIGVEKKYSPGALRTLLQSGRRMMPAFAHLQATELEAVAAWVLGMAKEVNQPYLGPAEASSPYRNLPYTSTGYNKFLTADGYPAIAPPWGTLNAIDLASGTIAWKIPLGETPALLKKGIHTGTENYGGPVVTAGGLVFIAATRDGKFRAFHKKTGKLLWETALPFPGFATPAVFEVNGKQMVVVACGGGKLGTPSGDVYLAFALPD